MFNGSVIRDLNAVKNIAVGLKPLKVEVNNNITTQPNKNQCGNKE
jgi:hypothetical protein